MPDTHSIESSALGHSSKYYPGTILQAFIALASVFASTKPSGHPLHLVWRVIRCSFDCYR